MAKNSGSWKPGQSGNPLGNPSGMKASIARRAAEVRYNMSEATPEIGQLMIDSALDPSIELTANQRWAIDRILDRAHGKAHQRIEINDAKDEEEVIENMTTPDLQLILKKNTLLLIEQLYERGELMPIVDRLKNGWKPGIELEGKHGQLQIEEKKSKK